MTLENIHELYEAHIETQVGLVATVVLHGIVPGHAGELLGHLDAEDRAEQVL